LRETCYKHHCEQEPRYHVASSCLESGSILRQDMTFDEWPLGGDSAESLVVCFCAGGAFRGRCRRP